MRRFGVDQLDLSVASFAQTRQQNVVVLISQRTEFSDADRNALGIGIAGPRRGWCRCFRAA